MTGARAGGPAWLDKVSRPAALVATLLIGALLLRALAGFLMATVPAIGDPREYDYGEGIVWQQMRLIFAGQGYGPIDSFPSIVFHYPPVYHAVTWTTARLGGFDELAAGRGVSLASTLISAVLVGLITARLASPPGRRARSVCGLVAGLVALSFPPVLLWARVMRVDMVACALSLGGLYLAMLALRRPRLIHLAALAFVAGVYAKQTMIAAPTSVFMVLLVLRPRLALAGIATSVAVGSVVLAMLTLETGGGFPRHIFLYNINRIDLSQIRDMVSVVARQAPYLALALYGFLTVAGALARVGRGERGWKGLWSRLREDPSSIQRLMLVAYLVLTTLMLVMIAKVGASVNYLIEWMLVLGILVGLSVQDLVGAAFPGRDSPGGRRPNVALIALLPAVFAIQATMGTRIGIERPPHSVRQTTELAELSRRIRAADRPVISDNMVLVVQSGKAVVWEPAIFAELAHTGFYDERPFVQKVRNGDFAFFVTDGERGSKLFDARYNPTVAEAMDAAYPKKQMLAGLVVHLPADAPLIR